MKKRIIENKLALVPYYPNYETALEWYQDPQLCKQVDNIDHVYSLDRLKRMYEYLSAHGDCFYIEYDGVLIGDITLRDNGEISIVICKKYQNKHIGRRCVENILDLAKEKGMDRVKAEIYSFNAQSRKMFTAIGFKQGEDDYYYLNLDERKNNMPYFCDNYPILERKEIAKDIYSYVIRCPKAALSAKAGQFVHIRADGYTLRRPISICEIDKEKGTIRIVFEVRGGGTDKLSQLQAGDKMDVILPLGNGFTIKEIPDDKKILVVGGGIGVPPMCGVASCYNNVKAIIGFRSKDKVILEEDLQRLGADVTVCTDDGSYGYNGVISTPLDEELQKGSTAMIYACGPTPMLKAVVDAAKKYNVPCEVSLEQRMACGVGACVGCACNIKRDGKNMVLRVCKDGPVFKSEEVVL